MATVIQRSLVGGIVSPSLYFRTDFSKFQNGARDLTNVIIERHGAASSRAGSRFVAACENESRKTRLISFQPTGSLGYVIELGENILNVYYNDEILKSSELAITAATSADPCVISVANHPYNVGDYVLISDVTGMTELNGNTYKITATTSTTFTIDVDSSGFTAYSSGGVAQKVIKFDTLYNENSLFDIRYKSNENKMTLTHPRYDIYELTINAESDWDFSALSTQPGMAAPTISGVTSGSGSNSYVYHLTAINKDTFEESLADTFTESSAAAPSTGSPHTISWGAVTDASEYNVYLEVNGVPGLIGIARGTSFVYDGAVTPDTTVTPPSARTPFDGNNKPTAIEYYQQRRVFAGGKVNPAEIQTSKSGLENNFSRSLPTQDDDAIAFRVIGVDSVEHLLDLNRLIVFAGNGEYASDESILTPTNINFRRQSSHGSSSVPPVRVGESALFLQRNKKIIRDLGFSFNVDGFQGNDVTVFAHQLFRDFEIVDWSYQETPDSILWCVRNDGVLLGLTYIREQGIFAWHKHEMFGDDEFDVYEKKNFEINNLSNPYNAASNAITGSGATWGQSFTIGSAGVAVTSIECTSYVNSTGATGTYTLSIYAVDSSGLPTGSAIGTSDPVDITEVSTEFLSTKTYYFSTPVELEANTKYAFEFDLSGLGGSSVFFRGVYNTSTDPYGGGGAFLYNGTSYTILDGGVDFNFAVFGYLNVSDVSSQRKGPRIESVCSVSNGSEDFLYLVVRREVDNSERRFIEKISTREVDSVSDLKYLDSHLTYDGRNIDSAHTMTLSGGTDWDYEETLTLTSSKSLFESGDVGNSIFLYTDDDEIRCEITAYTSATVVSVQSNKTVPSSLRGTATNRWAEAVDEFSGLDHLEGKDVAVFADGYVVASPLNRDYDTKTVSSGSISLDEPRAVVHVGLPYIQDIEPLDIELTGDQTLIEYYKNTNALHLYVANSRGIYAGTERPSDDTVDAIEGLNEFKTRDQEGYDSPVDLKTGVIEINIQSRWTQHGRVFIRQIDPIPMTILAIAPAGYLPIGGR